MNNADLLKLLSISDVISLTWQTPTVVWRSRIRTTWWRFKNLIRKWRVPDSLRKKKSRGLRWKSKRNPLRKESNDGGDRSNWNLKALAFSVISCSKKREIEHRENWEFNAGSAFGEMWQAWPSIADLDAILTRPNSYCQRPLLKFVQMSHFSLWAFVPCWQSKQYPSTSAQHISAHIFLEYQNATCSIRNESFSLLCPSHESDQTQILSRSLSSLSFVANPPTKRSTKYGGWHAYETVHFFSPHKSNHTPGVLNGWSQTRH